MPYLIYYEKMWAFRDWWYKEPFTIWRDKDPVVSHEHEELLDNTLSPSERDQILRGLFEWKEWSVDSSFLYLWKWAELYELISKDKTYPFIEIEKNILENLRDNCEFTKILKKIKHITDVWSWDGQKSIALLWKRETKNDGEAVEEAKNEEKSEDEVNRNGELILSDVSNEMLTKAIKNVKANSKNIKLWNAQVQQSQKHLSSYCNDNMFLFLWGTICNMTDEEIQKELKNMDNHWLFTWNYILLSYFTAPETKDEISNLIKIYNSKTNKAFHENWMDMLWLSKHNFEFDTIYQLDNWTKLKLENWVLNSYEWDFNNFSEWPFPWRIKWIIRAKIDSVVKLSDGTEISVKQWQEFTIHYSRRFSKEYIDKLFKKSDCEKTDIEINEGWDTMVLLRRKPKIWEIIRRNKKSIAVAFATAALTLCGVITHDVIKTNQENRQKEKALTNWSANRLLSHDVPYQRVYYEQATNELISALRLDELNKNDKNYIIELFNDFLNTELYKDNWIINVWVENQIGQQNATQFSTDELIQKFWVQYWYVLINNHNVTHYPYDIMTHDLIWTTYWISENLSFTPYTHTKNKVRFREHWWQNYWVYDVSIDSFNKNSIVLEYNDWLKEYLILKVKLRLENKYIYLGAEKKDWESYPEFSTNTVNWRIEDKSWLDPEILLNTREISWNDFGDLIFSNGRVDSQGIFHSVDSIPLLKRRDSNQILLYEHLAETPVYSIYAKDWVKYYVITIPTKWWKSVWLASTSLDWPYDIDTFKQLVENFDLNYLWRLPF